mmetsp:Transcript_14434/g.42427  ORF Transcript_14434/g.42427 Transcript_14434/m.42427 type:complete len:454 (-) Transcript_14434:460-1821(-)
MVDARGALFVREAVGVFVVVRVHARELDAPGYVDERAVEGDENGRADTHGAHAHDEGVRRGQREHAGAQRHLDDQRVHVRPRREGIINLVQVGGSDAAILPAGDGRVEEVEAQSGDGDADARQHEGAGQVREVPPRAVQRLAHLELDLRCGESARATLSALHVCARTNRLARPVAKVGHVARCQGQVVPDTERLRGLEAGVRHQHRVGPPGKGATLFHVCRGQRRARRRVPGDRSYGPARDEHHLVVGVSEHIKHVAHVDGLLRLEQEHVLRVVDGALRWQACARLKLGCKEMFSVWEHGHDRQDVIGLHEAIEELVNGRGGVQGTIAESVEGLAGDSAEGLKVPSLGASGGQPARAQALPEADETKGLGVRQIGHHGAVRALGKRPCEVHREHGHRVAAHHDHAHASGEAKGIHLGSRSSVKLVVDRSVRRPAVGRRGVHHKAALDGDRVNL